MQRLAIAGRVAAFSLGLGCLSVLLAGPAPAQNAKKDAAPKKEAAAPKRDSGSDDILPQAELKGDERTQFQTLAQGKPMSDRDGALLDKAADYYVNRLTHPKFKNPEPMSSDKRTLRTITEEAMKVVRVGDEKKRLKDDQIQFDLALGKRMHQRLKVVLEKYTEPIIRINAARLLAHLVEAGVDEATDTCLTLLAEPEEMDGVKFWCLRALREVTEGVKNGPLTPRQTKAAKALLDFVARKAPSFPEGPSSPEKDGFRYMRREAVRGLGNVRWPRLPGGKADGQPAWELLRLLARDSSVIPEPSLSEQLEATIGLCQYRTKLVNAGAAIYQPEYAAPVMGYFLVEFGTQFNNDKDAKEPLTRQFAWKVEAERLIEAVNAFKADNAADAYVKEFADKALSLLKDVAGDRKCSPNDLRVWLNNKAPKADKLFSDDPATAIPPAAAAAAGQ